MPRPRLLAACVFLGSLLLFGVQPMMGRTLLPSFGGSAAVWTVCLATYQILLLAGYLYAHFVSRLAPARQRRLHLALLAAAFIWTLLLAASRTWLRARIGNSGLPALEVLVCVLVAVGLPYTLLAAGSTLLQAWLAAAGGQGVYRLYAISNLGSFLGLLLYPFVLEPFVPLAGQWLGFAAAFAAYGLLLARVTFRPDIALESPERVATPLCRRVSWRLEKLPHAGRAAWLQDEHHAQDVLPHAGRAAWLQQDTTRRTCHCTPQSGVATNAGMAPTVNSQHATVDVQEASTIGNRQSAIGISSPLNTEHRTLNTQNEAPSTKHEAPSTLPSHPILWFLLPAASCLLMVATTNHLTMDVTPIPLMWALLLGAFLLSYVVGFSRAGEAALPLWLVLGILSAALAAGFIKHGGGQAFGASMLTGSCLVFFGGLFLHSWLYRIRPNAAHLTRYYLGIAAGGACGGALASLVAPVVCRSIIEYPVALTVLALAAVWFAWRWNHPELRGITEVLIVAGLLVPVLLGRHMLREGGDVIRRERSFYGTLKVTRAGNGPIVAHTLTHGGTLHGTQFVRGEWLRMPTTYYGALGGGLAVLNHPACTNRGLRVGLIGLGAGTMACYGRTNDFYRFFDINPQVVRIAQDTNLFTYWSGCPARKEIALGDARRNLEAERARGEPPYDVLVVDAYSGDSVPIHLATAEAFDLYRARLAPDGILAVHISNWHIDLLPLCKAAGRHLGMACVGVCSLPDTRFGTSAANWVLLGRKLPELHLPPGAASEIVFSHVRDIRLPTDERGSLLNLVRFGSKPPVKAADVSKVSLDSFFR